MVEYTKLLKVIESKLLVQSDSNKKTVVTNAVFSNMLSRVLLVEYDHFLLVTNLNTEQALRTADIVNASGVLITNVDNIGSNLITLAKELDVNLLTTKLSSSATFDIFKDCSDLTVKTY